MSVVEATVRSPLRLKVDTDLANSTKSPLGTSKRSRNENSSSARNKKLAVGPKEQPIPDNNYTYETSVIVFEALCSMEKDEASCVVLTPRAGDDFGKVQIKTVDDDQMTQLQLVLLLQRLFLGLVKPAKTQRHVENLIRVFGLSKRLACFDRSGLEVMLLEFSASVIRCVGDIHGRITRHSMFSKLKEFYGWKANLLKKSIETLFDNMVKAAQETLDSKAPTSLGTQELLAIVRRLISGSVKMVDIVVHKKILKLFL